MGVSVLTAGGIGANLATGNYAGAALGVASSILGGGLFGGGKQSSVLQGYRITGNATGKGFTGNVTAYDQLGHTWAADGPTRYLNNPDAILPNLSADVLKALGDKSVPIDLTVAPYESDPSPLSLAVSNAVSGSDAAKPPPNALATMPSQDDANVQAAKQKALREQVSRGGRASTVLTSDGPSDTLGS
jgi:hypothetical protein